MHVCAGMECGGHIPWAGAEQDTVCLPRWQHVADSPHPPTCAALWRASACCLRPRAARASSTGPVPLSGTLSRVRGPAGSRWPTQRTATAGRPVPACPHPGNSPTHSPAGKYDRGEMVPFSERETRLSRARQVARVRACCPPALLADFLNCSCIIQPSVLCSLHLLCTGLRLTPLPPPNQSNRADAGRDGAADQDGAFCADGGGAVRRQRHQRAVAGRRVGLLEGAHGWAPPACCQGPPHTCLPRCMPRPQVIPLLVLTVLYWIYMRVFIPLAAFGDMFGEVSRDSGRMHAVLVAAAVPALNWPRTARLAPYTRPRHCGHPASHDPSRSSPALATWAPLCAACWWPFWTPPAVRMSCKCGPGGSVAALLAALCIQGVQCSPVALQYCRSPLQRSHLVAGARLAGPCCFSS